MKKHSEEPHVTILKQRLQRLCISISNTMTSNSKTAMDTITIFTGVKVTKKSNEGTDKYK